MATQPKAEQLFDAEGSRLDMPRLEKTLGITFDSLFTPKPCTCASCGGRAWMWLRSKDEPHGVCVCLRCTGREGVVHALVDLDIQRTQHLGLDSLVGSPVFRAVLESSSAEAAAMHLPSAMAEVLAEEDGTGEIALTWLFEDELQARAHVHFFYDDRLARFRCEDVLRRIAADEQPPSGRRGEAPTPPASTESIRRDNRTALVRPGGGC